MALSASYDQSTNMKKLILLCICSLGFAITLFAQAPTASPIASPAAATATATATATAGGSPSDLANKIHQKLEKKLRGHHGITIDAGDKDEDSDLRDRISIDLRCACADRDPDWDVRSIDKPQPTAHDSNASRERSANSSRTACAGRASR